MSTHVVGAEYVNIGSFTWEKTEVLGKRGDTGIFWRDWSEERGRGRWEMRGVGGRGTRLLVFILIETLYY